MQHQNRNRRRKALLRERQCGSVALQNAAVPADVSIGQRHGERVAVLDAGHALRSPPQLGSRGTRAGTKFKNVLAQP